MQYKDKEYGFDILTERKNPRECFCHILMMHKSFNPYWIIVLKKELEKYFTRDEITTKHLFSKRDSKKKLSSNYDVFNKEFVGNRGKTRPLAKKAIVNRKIIPYIKKLIYLELVEFKPSKSKNDEITEEYRFTKLGRMVALLFLCNKIFR